MNFAPQLGRVIDSAVVGGLQLALLLWAERGEADGVAFWKSAAMAQRGGDSEIASATYRQLRTASTVSTGAAHSALPA